VRGRLAQAAGAAPVSAVAVAAAPPLWSDEQARFYAGLLAVSDYAARVAPLLGGPFDDLLDVGAGSGDLALRALGEGARWRAVEPSPAMRGLLAGHRPMLARRRIVLRIDACGWETLPDTVGAAVVLAANLGASHHDAARLHDALRPRARRSMVWVVAAQPGPSTFCLAGLLPAALHGADVQPAHERTLAQLGSDRQPHGCRFVDWTCRGRFADLAAAQRHFVERLALEPGSARAAAVADHVARQADAAADGIWLHCAKRSAVLTWSAGH